MPRPNPRKTTRLYRYLREAGIEQKQLALLAGLSEERVSRLVRGAMVARADEEQIISQALGVEPGRLFDPLAIFPEEEQRARKAAAWFATEDGQFFLRGLFAAALAEWRQVDLSPVELARLRAGVFAPEKRDLALFRQYYRSETWRARRTRLLRLRPCCERCQRAQSVMVHHTTYRRIGRELDTDLMAVCAECHHQLHGRKFWFSRMIDLGAGEPGVKVERH